MKPCRRSKTLARDPTWSRPANAASITFGISHRATCSGAHLAGSSKSPRSVGKPVFLHQRDAHEDFVAILREHRAGLKGGVAHCFTDGEKERDAYLELGLCIGITGWINDERRGLHLREVVKGIPADRLHDRNRRALSTAARHQAGAEDAAQRARVPALRAARDRRGAR